MSLVYLHGDLQRFGGPYNFVVSSPAEAIRALCAQVKGFRRRLGEGNFRVARRRSQVERDLGVDELSMRLRHNHELHIVPVVGGSSGGKSTGKIIIGVALVAAAFAFAPAVVGALGPTLGMGTTAFSVAGFGVSFAQIAGFGGAMILGGIAQLLSPSPSAPAAQSEVANPGGLFGGPANVSEQGNAIPLTFGRFICGTVVISSSLDAEAVAVTS